VRESREREREREREAESPASLDDFVKARLEIDKQIIVENDRVWKITPRVEEFPNRNRT
jgi:hypothetical protein